MVSHSSGVDLRSKKEHQQNGFLTKGFPKYCFISCETNLVRKISTLSFTYFYLTFLEIGTVLHKLDREKIKIFGGLPKILWTPNKLLKNQFGSESLLRNWNVKFATFLNIFRNSLRLRIRSLFPYVTGKSMNILHRTLFRIKMLTRFKFNGILNHFY